VCSASRGEQTDRLVYIAIVICELEQHAINLEAAEPICLSVQRILPCELRPVHTKAALAQR